MSAEAYLEQVNALVARIESTQLPAIREAAQRMAESIAVGRAVHLFGSGHSVIPVLDIFPRYGSFVGFHPIMDPRLMWFNVVGPGGARELLWLERQEGYIAQVLLSYHLDPRDTMLIFSHGGLNAAPVEMALAAKEQGLTVVAVTSLANHRASAATHSSGKRLADVADIAIDNCVDPEDAAVQIEGRREKVAALSTVAAVTISMALVAEVARELAARDVSFPTFVSPNVPGVDPEHNKWVFQEYTAFIRQLGDPTG
ncbi:MAG TPA: SIS domain-containing protein [Caldilineae bacterium]|nr:SIS domain-containing protein [Caldilineae bacterium]